MRKIKIIPLLTATFLCAVFSLSSLSFAVEAPKEDTPQESTVSPAATTTDTSYVYDLKKLIEKSKDNIKRVNEKIQEQAIYKRNQQREEKAREYYERAIELMEAGKIKESRDLFEKSIKITEHAEMDGYIRGSEKRFKLQEKAIKKEDRAREERLVEQQKMRQQQVQEAYNMAITLYKQKKLKEARDEFILVEQLMPEYKATRSYLKLVEQDIAVQDNADVKKQKKEIQRQLEEAEVARVREKEMWRKEIELKEQERRSKLVNQAKEKYTQALEVYRKKDFVGAKEKFQEVEWVIPDYKATRKYLERLDRDIKEQEQIFKAEKDKGLQQKGWEEELARKKVEAEQKKGTELKNAEEKRKVALQAGMYYQKATKMVDDKKYAEARDQFLEIQKIYPDYQATEIYLERLNKKLGIIETAPEKVSGEVKDIYAAAVRSYKDKDFTVAKLKFEKVEFMSPNYESTRRYLSKLDKDYDPTKAASSDKDKTDSKKPESSELLFNDVDLSALSSAEYKALVEKAEPIYAQAISLYTEKKYEQAREQFQSVEYTLPNYKSTRPYLKRVNQLVKRVEQQRYKEEQIKQAEIINILAKQASSLFHKIQQLSDDKTTASAKKKFAMVDKIFANMSREQAKLLEEIAEEERKLKLEEIAYEQEIQKSEFANAIDPIYDEAVKLYQEQKYDEAKEKFLKAQSTIKNYRSSNRYLNLIEKQNQLLQQVIKEREEKIRELQLKADEEAQIAERNRLALEQSNMIKGLVGQAEAINDEIVNLSKERNFEVIKAKFVELEKIVDNLLTIKGKNAQRETADQPNKRKDIEPSTPPQKRSVPDKDDVDVKRKKYDLPKEKTVVIPKPKVKATPRFKNYVESLDAELRHSELEESAAEAATVSNEQPQPAVGAPTEVVAEQTQPLEPKTPLSPDESRRQRLIEERRRAREEEQRRIVEDREHAAQVKAQDKQKIKDQEKKNREIYQEALKNYEDGQLPEAKEKFLQILKRPGYGASAKKYLKKIDQMISEKKKQELLPKKEEPKGSVTKEVPIPTPAEEPKVEQVNIEKKTEAPVKIKKVLKKQKLMPKRVHHDYMESLSLRGRKAVEPGATREEQVAQMKDVVAVENNTAEEKKPEETKTAQAPQEAAPKVNEQPSGTSPNEKASWLKRRQQKALSDKRKKYFEEKHKEAQKEEIKEEAKNVVVKKSVAEKKYSAEGEILARRQRARELKQRKVYERELKNPRQVNLDKVMVQADKEDQKNQVSKIRKEQELLRKQREEEMAQRTDKERQLSTIINQGQQDPMKIPKAAPKVSDKKPQLKKEPEPPVVNDVKVAGDKDKQSADKKAKEDAKSIADKAAAAKEAEVKAVKAQKDALRKQFESGIEKMYREALTYYKNGMNKESRKRFADVEELSPNYKKTRAYIKRVDQTLISEQKNLRNLKDIPAASKEKEQSLRAQRLKKDVEAAPANDETVQTSKNVEQPVEASEAAQKTNEKAVADAAALKAEKAAELTKAREEMKKNKEKIAADELAMKAKKVAELTKAREEMKKNKEKIAADELAMKAKKAAELTKAREEMKKNKEKIAAEELAMKAQKAEKAEQVAQAEKVEKEKKAELHKQFESGVDEVYQEALTYYKSGMYKESRDRLSDVEDLYPGYKKTRTYIQRADQAIINDQKRRLDSKDKQESDSLPRSDDKPSKSVSQTTPANSLPAVSSSSNKNDAVSSALDMYETGK